MKRVLQIIILMFLLFAPLLLAQNVDRAVYISEGDIARNTYEKTSQLSRVGIVSDAGLDSVFCSSGADSVIIELGEKGLVMLDFPTLDGTVSHIKYSTNGKHFKTGNDGASDIEYSGDFKNKIIFLEPKYSLFAYSISIKFSTVQTSNRYIRYRKVR